MIRASIDGMQIAYHFRKILEHENNCSEQRNGDEDESGNLIDSFCARSLGVINNAVQSAFNEVTETDNLRRFKKDDRWL